MCGIEKKTAVIAGKTGETGRIKKRGCLKRGGLFFFQYRELYGGWYG
jgi:hypothetical protein